MVGVRIEAEQREDDLIHFGSVVVHGHFSVSRGILAGQRGGQPHPAGPARQVVLVAVWLFPDAIALLPGGRCGDYSGDARQTQGAT